ncbi:MAG: Lrp/AsnC family transcriptional regulator [Pseudomonadota bacterium]
MLSKQDRMLLKLLQKEARLSITKLAERVNMSESTCARRVRSLEETGIISHYSVQIDPEKLGYNVSAYVIVRLDQRTETDAKKFFDAVGKEDRIVEAVAVTGTPDLILRIVAKNMEDFTDLTMHGILRHKSVRDISSCMVMKQIKPDNGFPV